MLKVSQRHIVVGKHISICHRHRESFPSQVLISQEVLRNFFGRKRRYGYVDCGRDLLGRRILRFWIKIEDLHWRSLIRDKRSRFDVLRLGWLMLFLPTMPTWEITQVNPRWYIFSFFACGRTRLGLHPLFNCLVHNLLAFVLFHCCHSWKEGHQFQK